ncbi:small ubiquitin-like modifier 1 [Haematococcus lacustris]
MAEGGGDSAVPKQESAVINIIVKDQGGNEVHFKIKPHTKFEKVFSAYCAKKGQDVATLRFLFDGKRIEPSSTPAMIDMEDGDSIDCLIMQLGGRSCATPCKANASRGRLQAW